MGLDAVEIVMEIEDAFDVTLEDAEAVHIRTPGDLIEAVWRKVAHADAQGCLTQRAFNLLRAALLSAFPLKRRDIEPTTRMEAIVPKADRNQLRKQFATTLRTDPLPALVRPRWLVVLLTAPCLAAGIGVVVALLRLAPSLSWGTTAFTGAVSAVVLGYLTALATKNLRCEFPPLIVTVGDLSRWIMTHKPDLTSSGTARHWTREQVAARVREIVIEQLDCANSYREDAGFIDDLGTS
jgi:hypothetical protein